MEIILGKRIEEVERERISRRDGLRRAVYLGAIYRGCETGRALTLQHLPFLSLSLLGNGRRAKAKKREQLWLATILSEKGESRRGQ